MTSMTGSPSVRQEVAHCFTVTPSENLSQSTALSPFTINHFQFWPCAHVYIVLLMPFKSRLNGFQFTGQRQGEQDKKSSTVSTICHRSDRRSLASFSDLLKTIIFLKYSLLKQKAAIQRFLLATKAVSFNRGVKILPQNDLEYWKGNKISSEYNHRALCRHSSVAESRGGLNRPVQEELFTWV